MRLRQIRLEKNVSIENIAKCLNVSIQCIYNYETGKREPKLETLKKLAELFNCSIDELL